MSDTVSEDQSSRGINPIAFIRENMTLLPVPAFPSIKVYAAHAGSGLRRLLDEDEDGDPSPPYWAYVWGGGAALVSHIQSSPQIVAGKRVLDLGAGSGIVGIAAAQNGAKEVVAAEIDPMGLAALQLNASANGVILRVTGGDVTLGPAPDVDLVLVGDLFYAPKLAEQVSAFLSRCIFAGVEVLVGDPFRAHLPVGRLQLIAEYDVADFGDARGSSGTRSGVFRFLA